MPPGKRIDSLRKHKFPNANRLITRALSAYIIIFDPPIETKRQDVAPGLAQLHALEGTVRGTRRLKLSSENGRSSRTPQFFAARPWPENDKKPLRDRSPNGFSTYSLRTAGFLLSKDRPVRAKLCKATCTPCLTSNSV